MVHHDATQLSHVWNRDKCDLVLKLSALLLLNSGTSKLRLHARNVSQQAVKFSNTLTTFCVAASGAAMNFALDGKGLGCP